MKPQRIQRKRTKGYRMPANTVYVGRPTKWGNPFSSAAQYRSWLTTPSPGWPMLLYASIEQLRGKHLACWCPLDQPCHADVLLEIANS